MRREYDIIEGYGGIADIIYPDGWIGGGGGTGPFWIPICGDGGLAG